MKPLCSQRGSIIIYIFVAIFLMGMLIATLSSGPTKSASSQQLDTLVARLKADVDAVHSAAAECALTYSAGGDVNGDDTVDATDNPNNPFPIYCANAACALGTMTSGSAGKALSLTGCPGAPATGPRVLFNAASLMLLGDTSRYTTTYFNDGTEGVYIRIESADSDPLWSEAISRLELKYSKCSAVATTDNPDPLTHNCSGGCFYYWVLRRSTSSSSFEATCP